MPALKAQALAGNGRGRPLIPGLTSGAASRGAAARAAVFPVVLHRIVPWMSQRQLCFATMTGPPGAAARPYLA